LFKIFLEKRLQAAVTLFLLDKFPEMTNKNKVMRRSLFILVLVWLLTGVAAAAEAPKVGADGASLVVETGKDSGKSSASGDTLYDLLGKEVQVYIYSNKTRVWPKPMVISGMTIKSGLGYRSSYGRHDPRWDALINKYAGAYGVDPALVRAVMRNESGFNPGAVSPKGAQGLMQLMPGTAALMGVRDPLDPEQNIAGGVGYLRHCLDRFGHNAPLAVAAYNAGPEAVARYGTIPPYQETQVFVNNVIGTYNTISANPGLNKPAAGGIKPTAKGTAAKPAAAPEKDKDAPRRPKAKIIEVRSGKIQTKAMPILKD
jgi:hypothetical protein